MNGKGRYHDGRTANVRNVVLSQDETNLIVTDAADGVVIGRWPLGSLFRDVRQPAAVVIGCGSDDARIEVTDREFAARLPIKSTTWSRQDLFANRKLIYVWLFGSVLFVGAAIGARRPIARFVTHQISAETERKVSKSLMGQLHFEKCKLTSEEASAVEKLLRRLVPDDSQRGQLQVDLVRSETSNAYTLPGGQIFILSGLIKRAETPEELAGVLAHEISHAQNRHVMQSIVESMLFVSLLNLAVGDASAVLLVDPATASRLLSLKMGRDMEREADQGAIEMLAQAKVSHQGLLDFFERQNSKDLNKNSYLKEFNMISTHPLSSERIDTLKAALMINTQPEILSKREWESLKTACPSEL